MVRGWEPSSRRRTPGQPRRSGAEDVDQGLDYMTFEERQQFLRLVVESVTVAEGRIMVETVIPQLSDGNLRNARSELVEPPVIYATNTQNWY